MSYDVSTGLSGAASGAAAGSTFGPAGTIIGGTLGLASGFFGGDDGGSSARDRAIQRNRKSLRALVDRAEKVREQSPTETELFTVGSAELQEQAERQADEDAAQAAARGLEGSQFEVAQDQNRAQQQGEGLRALVRSAAQADRQREQAAQQAVQRQRESLNALISDQARAQTRRQQAQNEALRGVFSNLPFVLSQADFGFGDDGGAVSESAPFTPGNAAIG